MDDFESLVSSFIETIIEDNEHPRAALISTDGVVRSTDGGSETLGSPAVVVVTNARLVFITPDRHMELQEWSVRYHDVAGVTIERAAANRVEATTCDGVRWRCTLPNADPQVLDAVTRHLRWVDHVRTGLLTLEERVEEAATDIREHADDMNWDAAQEAYQEVRTDLDALISTVQLTTPMADDTLAPELTDIERTLEEANVRLYIERSRSQLELGRYLVEHEDYNRAADVLERARDLHLQAEGQSDAVERADAFAFGRQRGLNEDLERLEWELTEVAAEPIRQAHEAALRAEETDDLDAAVEYWETAVRRYDRILALDWWKEAQEATEEIDDARAEREQAVERLVEARAELANERWTEGVRSRERSDTSGAIECFEAAITHLERAHELAVEFSHGNADDLESRLTEIRSTVAELRADSTPGSAGPVSDLSSGPALPRTGDASEENEPGPSENEERHESSDGEDESPDGEEETSQQTLDSDGDDPATQATSATGVQSRSVTARPTVRLRQETFTAEKQVTGEWMPPPMSDLVAIETPPELTRDLPAIGLPGDVSPRDANDGDVTTDSGTDD